MSRIVRPNFKNALVCAPDMFAASMPLVLKLLDEGFVDPAKPNGFRTIQRRDAEDGRAWFFDDNGELRRTFTRADLKASPSPEALR